MKYIDLGLPSGTLWAETDSHPKSGIFGFFSIKKLLNTRSHKIPTVEQFNELLTLPYRINISKKYCEFKGFNGMKLKLNLYIRYLTSTLNNNNTVQITYLESKTPDYSKLDIISKYYRHLDDLVRGFRVVKAAKSERSFNEVD